MRARKHKIAIGCLSAVGIFILAAGLLVYIGFRSVTRPVRQAVRHLQTMSEADMQRWIARTEAMIADYDAVSDYDDLPDDVKDWSRYFGDLPGNVKVPPIINVGYDKVNYHWCAGIMCANLVISRLPEGGHKVVAFHSGHGEDYERIYPAENTEPEPTE